MFGHADKICFDIFQNGLTLVEKCTVALYFGSDVCQIKLGFVQVNPKSALRMFPNCYFMLCWC